MLRSPLKSSLSPSGRRLVVRMQRLNFGTIKDLRICGGEPIFDPAPKVTQQLKMGGDDPRPEVNLEDFSLKAQVVDMFERFTELGDGIVEIEIKNGLPFRLLIEQPV